MTRRPTRRGSGPRLLDPGRLDQDLAERAWAASAPGLAVAAVVGRHVCYARGFGATSVEADGVPVTPETLFHIASTTKPLTGTAGMRPQEWAGLGGAR